MRGDCQTGRMAAIDESLPWGRIDAEMSRRCCTVRGTEGDPTEPVPPSGPSPGRRDLGARAGAKDASLRGDVHRPARGHLAQGQVLGSALNGDRRSGGHVQDPGGRDEELLGRRNQDSRGVCSRPALWPNGTMRVWPWPFATCSTISPGAVAFPSAASWAAVRFPDCKSASAMNVDAPVWPMLPPVPGATSVTFTPEMLGVQIPTGLPDAGSTATWATGFISSGVVQAALLVRSDTCCAVAT